MADQNRTRSFTGNIHGMLDNIFENELSHSWVNSSWSYSYFVFWKHDWLVPFMSSASERSILWWVVAKVNGCYLHVQAWNAVSVEQVCGHYLHRLQFICQTFGDRKVLSSSVTRKPCVVPIFLDLWRRPLWQPDSNCWNQQYPHM